MTTIDLEMIRGDNFLLPLRFIDPFDNSTLNVSGWTLRFTVKHHRFQPDSEAVYKADLVLDNKAANGEFALELIPAETKTFNPITYVFDVQIESTNGTVITAAQGHLRVKQGVTER